MSAFKLSRASEAKLEKVHPDLVRVVKRAIEITETAFTITEGLRTMETQKKYEAKGVRETMKSMHLEQPDGFSHAVDLYPSVNGKLVVDWKVDWLTKDECAKAWADVPNAMKQAAQELGVAIEWGGDWKSYKDGPHYQLK
jgi:peptidoglycan L-alanyl-D-glutamate endopeptidase CwlK